MNNNLSLPLEINLSRLDYIVNSTKILIQDSIDINSKGLLTAVWAAIQAIRDSISSQMSKVYAYIVSQLDTVIMWFGEVWEAINEGVATGIDVVQKWIANGVDAVVKRVRTIIDKVSGWISYAVTAIKNWTKTMRDQIVKRVNTIYNWIVIKIDKIKTWIQDSVDEIVFAVGIRVNQAIAVLKTPIDLLTEAIGDIPSLFTGLLSNFEIDFDFQIEPFLRSYKMTLNSILNVRE